MNVPWPIRSVLAGTAGTAALSLSYATERRLRARHRGPLMTATFALFPLLGRTPPPWCWQADVMATRLATHAAYVSAVAAADDGVRRLGS
ncbi:MAG: hypothetical protein FWD04_02100 [Conexibacteraceae bacterium]|nr:hypothetical protein [Conexibacteraceae bacterium]